MTIAPPSLSPPVSKRSYTIRTLIAWLIIVGIVGLIAIGATRAERRERLHAITIDPTLILQSRYAIGIQALLTSSRNTSRNVDSIVGSIDRDARRPIQKLAVVPVVAELAGKSEALARLKTISDPKSQHDVVTLAKLYQLGPDTLTPDDRKSLIDHLQFNGELALTWQMPADDPARKVLIKSAQRTAIALIVFVTVIFLALIAGIALLITTIVLGVQGKIRRMYVAPQPPRAPVHYLEAFALYLVGMIAIGLVVHFAFHTDALWPSALYLLLVAPAIAWPARKFGKLNVAKSIGWTIPTPPPPPVAPPPLPQPLFYGFPTYPFPPASPMLAIASPPPPAPARPSVLREIFFGLVAYLAGLPIVALAMIVTMILSKAAGASPSHPIIESIGKDPRLTLQLYLLACGVAPMVEETLFRGFLYHWLRARMHWVFAAMLVGLIFAAIHPQGWTTIPVLGAIGFNLAAIREWRGSLLGSMAAHFLNNFAVTTFLVFALG